MRHTTDRKDSFFLPLILLTAMAVAGLLLWRFCPEPAPHRLQWDFGAEVVQRMNGR